MGIASGYDLFGRLLDFHIGGYALFLDDETVLGPEGEARRRDRSTIHQHRESEDANEPAPGALSDERAELEGRVLYVGRPGGRLHCTLHAEGIQARVPA